MFGRVFPMARFSLRRLFYGAFVASGGLFWLYLINTSDELSRTDFDMSKLNTTDTWLSNQNNRQRHLAEACQRLSLDGWTASEVKTAASQANTLFVDDRLKYIYCLVPKVACTSWTRVLLVASGKVRTQDPNKLPQNKVNFLRHKGRILRPLAKYSPEEVDYRLKNYFKFMFVRHPFDRIVSAYRDRIIGDHAKASRLLTRGILKNVTRVGRKQRRRKGRRVATFAEFVQYVADPANNPATANPHWRPQSDLCHPCRIQYNLIGHYSTIQTDASVVLKQIGVHNLRFPFEDPDNQRRVKSNDLVKNWFAQAPANDVEKLRLLVYAEDFEIFGFDWNSNKGSMSVVS